MDKTIRDKVKAYHSETDITKKDDISKSLLRDSRKWLDRQLARDGMGWTGQYKRIDDDGTDKVMCPDRSCTREMVDVTAEWRNLSDSDAKSLIVLLYHQATRPARNSNTRFNVKGITERNLDTILKLERKRAIPKESRFYDPRDLHCYWCTCWPTAIVEHGNFFDKTFLMKMNTQESVLIGGNRPVEHKGETVFVG